MDADKLDEQNAAQSKLQQRRSLALARLERENERKALLGTLMAAESEAGHLRNWIARQELHLKAKTHGELGRLLQWASGELAALETITEPGQLAELLRRQNLFPEADGLSDPLGDPPPLRPWGR